jgi:amino acid permease
MKKDKIICVILFMIIAVMLMVGGWSDTHYSTTATVYAQEGELTTLVDAAGYLWEVTDRPDLTVGDIVTVKFYNNGTDYKREDDIILSISVDK